MFISFKNLYYSQRFGYYLDLFRKIGSILFKSVSEELIKKIISFINLKNKIQ